jgi:translation initiation factor IF-3
VSINDALRLAQEADLDLVEVAPTARPPVCKLMDYGKFKYESALKARESRKNQAQTVIKEIKIRPKIDPHDYGTKKGHVERFLRQGDKVKVTIMFRGREQSRPELGYKLLQRLAGDVEELGFVESQPKQDGRNMIMVIGPLRKKADAKAVRGPDRASARAAAPSAQASHGDGDQAIAVSRPAPALQAAARSAPAVEATASRASAPEHQESADTGSVTQADLSGAAATATAPPAPAASAATQARSAAPRPGPTPTGGPRPAAPRPAAPKPGPAGSAPRPAAPRPGPAGAAAPRPAAPRPSAPRPGPVPAGSPRPSAPKPSAPRPQAAKPGEGNGVPPRARVGDAGSAGADSGG